MNASVSADRETNAFDDWFATKQFLSSSITLAKHQCSSIPCDEIEDFINNVYINDIIRLQIMEKYGHFCRLFDCKEPIKEKQLVFSTIQRLLSDMNNEVSKVNPLFKFKIIQVGSSMEETRPFRPDEFDFLLICTEIIRYLEISRHNEIHTSVTIKTLDVSGLKYFQKEWIGPGGYFDFETYSISHRLAIYTALKNIFDCGSYGAHLFIEPLLYSGGQILCIHLKWRGPFFKDMPISIDLVHALKIADYNPEVSFVDEPCQYYCFPKGHYFFSEGISLWPVAFSEVELKLVRNLPEEARKGLKLAKGVRINELFPEKIIQTMQNVSSLDECLKTYMLKTNVIVLSKVVPISKQFNRTQWAYMTYGLVVKRLLLLGDLPNIFDVSPKHKVFHVFACRHRIDLACEEERKCCIQRKNLAIIALNIREVFRCYLEKQGHDTAQLDEFVMTALQKQPFEWFQRS